LGGTLVRLAQIAYVRCLFDRILFVVFTMFTFFLFRVVLFSLVIGDSQSITNSTSIGYLLVEFPILLFFCFVSNYVISWAMIVASSADLGLGRKRFLYLVNGATILFNSTIFGLFILMIILYETIVHETKPICGNTQLLYDSNASFALIIAYRVIFSTVAILLGIALFIIGCLMLQLLLTPDIPVHRLTIIKVGSATIVGTFGLLAQAVYYLIITASRSKQSVFLSLSILIVDEIIPALIFLGIASVFQKDGKGIKAVISSSTGKSGSKGKSGSGKGSSGSGTTGKPTQNSELAF